MGFKGSGEATGQEAGSASPEDGQQGSTQGGQQGSTQEAGRLVNGNNDETGGSAKSEGESAGRTGFDDLPAETQAEIRALRREAQRFREEAKGSADKARQELLSEVGKLLGGGSTEMTPEELHSRLDKVSTERTGAIVELAVHRAASKVGGDPEALLDSRTFLTRVGKLDPDADDFSAKVAEEIKAAVQDNPRLGSGAPATRSGGEIGGASGERSGDSWADMEKRAREARRRF